MAAIYLSRIPCYHSTLHESIGYSIQRTQYQRHTRVFLPLNYSLLKQLPLHANRISYRRHDATDKQQLVPPLHRRSIHARPRSSRLLPDYNNGSHEVQGLESSVRHLVYSLESDCHTLRLPSNRYHSSGHARISTRSEAPFQPTYSTSSVAPAEPISMPLRDSPYSQPQWYGSLRPYTPTRNPLTLVPY